MVSVPLPDDKVATYTFAGHYHIVCSKDEIKQTRSLSDTSELCARIEKEIPDNLLSMSLKHLDKIESMGVLINRAVFQKVDSSSNSSLVEVLIKDPFEIQVISTYR